MNEIPIVGQRALLCKRCREPVKKGPQNLGVVCMNVNCGRFGLISIVAVDPFLEKEQLENEQSALEDL